MSSKARETVFMERTWTLTEQSKELKVLARINRDGRLFLASDAGELVESYDWARFGRLAYRAATGKEPPEQLYPAPDQGGL